MFDTLSLDAPNVGEREKSRVLAAIDAGHISTYGPLVAQLESNFAHYLNTGHPIAVQTGTAAIHLALLAAGIGPGDEVLVPALTFVATVNPVLYVGATPIFVDIDPETWTIDYHQAATKITAKTKALIPVHLYGVVADMTHLKQLAQTHSLVLIEDATESLGARWQDR